MKKSDLREAIIHQLRQDLARQSSAAELAHDEAISEESRAENKWDTHSQEAAYLAEGQAKLAGEIGAHIEFYENLSLPDFGRDDPIALGAVVGLEASAGAAGKQKRAWFFLGPKAGGLELEVDGKKILVVTPQSPLGRSIIGRRVGDAIATAGREPGASQRIASIQ